MGRIVSVLLVVVLILSGTALWAKTYTLEEAIELAKQHDPNLERFRGLVKTAGGDLWNAAGQFLPSLDLSVAYAKNTYSEPREAYIDSVLVSIKSDKGYSSGYTLSYTFFDGFSNIWNYLAARADKGASEYDLIQANSDLAYVVKGSYYLVSKSKRDLDVAREAVSRSEEILKLFEEKYSLGSASLSEVLKQRVQVGQDKLTLLTAGNVHELAKAQLALTIGIDPNSDFDIAELPPIKESLKPFEQILSEILGAHPMILSAESQLRSSRFGVWSAWGGYWPRLDLRYSKDWQKETLSDAVKFDSHDNTGTLWIGLTFNVFDGFMREAGRSRAKATFNNARANEFYTRNAIIKRIKDAYLGVKLSEQTLVLTEDIERSAAEDMELVQAKYNLGAAALWELLDAQVSLKRAQFDKVKAEFDYTLTLAKLNNSMGR